MNLSSWPEIGSDGDVLLMPYVPKEITGYDDDEKKVLQKYSKRIFRSGYLVITTSAVYCFIYCYNNEYGECSYQSTVNEIRYIYVHW